MVFPIALVVSSTMLFVLTLIVTCHEQPWKTSELATIFHGLAPGDVGALGRVDRYADMRQLAKGVPVRLLETELGLKLVAQGEIGGNQRREKGVSISTSG
jgi:hypothetical protein